MKRNWFIKILLILCTCKAAISFANVHPYFSINGGYGFFQHAFKNDGGAGIVRVALGANTSFSRKSNNLLLGSEIGMQTGHSMRINMGSAADVFTTPVAINITPPIDFLLTIKYHCQTRPIFLQAKGGAAYLKAIVQNTNTIPNKTEIRPEIQLGAGVDLSKKTRLLFSYQRIFGRSVTLKNVSPTVGTAQLSGLPTLQAGFVGIEINI